MKTTKVLSAPHPKVGPELRLYAEHNVTTRRPEPRGIRVGSA